MYIYDKQMEVGAIISGLFMLWVKSALMNPVLSHCGLHRLGQIAECRREDFGNEARTVP